MKSICLFVLLLIVVASTTKISHQKIHIGGAPRQPEKSGRGEVIISTMEDPAEIQRATRVRALHGYQGFPPVAYSGYVTVNKTYGANLFFWFFESQTGDMNAPFLLWLQGGPGCPSLLGEALEQGPYHLNMNLTMTENPFTWNKNYHMLYIDQPAGVGFSFVENGKYVTNEEQMAAELYTGLVDFFRGFPQFKKNDFYVFGESYGGKYVPSISYYILQQNLLVNSSQRINLKGMGVGDGLTDPINQVQTYADYSYANGLVDEKQKKVIENLQQIAIQKIMREDWVNASTAICDVFLQVLEYSGNPNVLDIRTYQQYDFGIVGKYFNQPEVKQSLHVGNHTFKGADCNDPAGNALNNDIGKSVAWKIPFILDNIKVLIYNGQFDLEVNLIGTQKWLENLNWRGIPQFLQAERIVWNNTIGEVAGFVRHYQTLYQTIMVAAGHLVPMNQPRNSLDMVRNFIEGKWQ